MKRGSGSISAEITQINQQPEAGNLNLTPTAYNQHLGCHLCQNSYIHVKKRKPYVDREVIEEGSKQGNKLTTNTPFAWFGIQNQASGLSFTAGVITTCSYWEKQDAGTFFVSAVYILLPVGL